LHLARRRVVNGLDEKATQSATSGLLRAATTSRYPAPTYWLVNASPERGPTAVLVAGKALQAVFIRWAFTWSGVKPGSF